jgi:hypothetical protein
MLSDKPHQVAYDKRMLAEQLLLLEDPRIINLVGEILLLANENRANHTFLQSYNAELEKSRKDIKEGKGVDHEIVVSRFKRK